MKNGKYVVIATFSKIFLNQKTLIFFKPRALIVDSLKWSGPFSRKDSRKNSAQRNRL